MSTTPLPLMSSTAVAPTTLSALVLSILLLRQQHPTEHETNVAVLNERCLRSLSPLPMRAVDAELGSPLDPSLQPSSSLPAIQHLLTDADEFYRITLLSPAEFILLHSRLNDSLILSRTHLQSTSPHLHPMPTKLNTFEQLLLWLLHIADEGNKALSLLFGNLHPTTIFRIADHVTWCVNTVFDDLIQWPTADERQQLHGFFSICDTAVAVLDGTHCEISKPTHDETVYHSGYKHKHTQNYLVCVNVLGVVISVEGPYPGRKNDRGVYNQSLLGSHPEQFFSPGERLLADGGFVGGGPLLVPIHSTIIDAAQEGKTRELLKEINQEVSDNRVLVEDVFGWIKGRAHVLDSRYRRKRERQAEVFWAACRLHNFVRLHRIGFANK